MKPLLPRRQPPVEAECAGATVFGGGAGTPRRAAPPADPAATPAVPAILLVGHPNVGKSVLFHRLTGAYVNVSNYPGTTVEVARAAARFDSRRQLLDTPGVLALPARSDDERATLHALLAENCEVLVQVGDAKNLRRTLTLTAVLAELGLPMVLALNMRDEAVARGVEVDLARLAQTLAIPVVGTVATGSDGIAALIARLPAASRPAGLLRYDAASEALIETLAARIEEICPHPRLAGRGLAVLFLGGDPAVEAWLAEAAGPAHAEFTALRRQHSAGPELAAMLAQERSRAAERTAADCVRQRAPAMPLWSQRLGRWTIDPYWSWPILAIVLYALYRFVGVFGAGTLVGLIEQGIFAKLLNPAVRSFAENALPWPWLTDLLVGDYGLWTMGMTYALALILPIVTTFFIAFGILEDSGYLARLSVVANRLFAMIGLNGRAVLPMVLGLGCVTMATLTTRILHSRRERLIATFLLALAIPCSAQLGVVLGMLGGIGFGAVLGWLLAVVGVLLLTGWLAARLIPGRRIPLVTELPPLRRPSAGNVLKKTGGRLKWYLLEVIPLFLFGALLMFLLDRSGILPAIIAAAEPLVSGWLGLPREAATAFVMGFVRRDFGATGLFAMGGALSPTQAMVGMITITLFVPCIASLMMIIREQGLRIALTMLGVIVPFAFLVGGVFNFGLRLVGGGP